MDKIPRIKTYILKRKYIDHKIKSINLAIMLEPGNDMVIYTNGKYYFLSMHVPVDYDLQMRQILCLNATSHFR